MTTFDGFPAGKVHLTPVPEPFFTQLLPQIEHLGELKLCLYAFWLLDRQEGAIRYMRRADLAQDKRIMQTLGDTSAQADEALDEALERAVARGALLAAPVTLRSGTETLYFLNSPKGRAAVNAIQSGEWQPTGDEQNLIDIGEAPPNIFRLYEENIGPLTPLIADALGEAEDTYPIEWIEDAIRIAVERNKRNWRYAEAILERWLREGRDVKKDKQKDRRDSKKTHRRHVEGKYSDFVEH